MLALASLVAISCSDPFALRDGEIPEPLPDWWRSPTQPHMVLDNLRALYIHSAPTVIGRLLDDRAFLFVPDGADTVARAGVNMLSGDQEISVTRSMLESATSDSAPLPFLLLSEEPSFPDRASPIDTVTLVRRYELVLYDPFGRGDPEPVRAEGTAVFLLSEDVGRSDWRILTWTDRRGGTTWSWGQVKLEIAGDG